VEVDVMLVVVGGGGWWLVVGGWWLVVVVVGFGVGDVNSVAEESQREQDEERECTLSTMTVRVNMPASDDSRM
jgi:hypothetical protein